MFGPAVFGIYVHATSFLAPSIDTQLPDLPQSPYQVVTEDDTTLVSGEHADSEPTLHFSPEPGKYVQDQHLSMLYKAAIYLTICHNLKRMFNEICEERECLIYGACTIMVLATP